MVIEATTRARILTRRADGIAAAVAEEEEEEEEERKARAQGWVDVPGPKVGKSATEEQLQERA